MKIGFKDRAKIAGMELLHGNVGNAIKAFASPSKVLLSSSTYGNGAGKWFFGLDGAEFNFTFTGHASAVKAYQECPPLTAIINKKAQAYINGVTWVMDTEKKKEAKNEAATRIRKILANPNPLQTWQQFEAQSYIYQQLFGYAVILVIKPVGFDNTYAKAVWCLAPSLVDIEENEDVSFQPDGQQPLRKVIFTYGGNSINLPLDDVFLLKDITPSFCTRFIPESRLRALEMPINNTIGVYESRNTLINYRGAQGFLAPEKDPLGNIPLNEDEKEELQKQFRKYGLKANQWQVIISNAMLKWNQMGFATRELMLFEEVEDNIMRMCDTYNWPYELMSSSKGVTFANKNEAKTLAYQDAILPEAISNYTQWNTFFNCAKWGIVLDRDYSHVPALQGDELKKAQARKSRNDALFVEFKCNVITLNRWRELNGEDTVAGDDIYYSDLVKGGRLLPVQSTGNNSNNEQNNNSNANQT